MRTIKVTPNYSKRTFTINKESFQFWDGKKVRVLKVRFRTLPTLDANKFNELLNNTQSDWQYYLETMDNDYYLVKQYKN